MAVFLWTLGNQGLGAGAGEQLTYAQASLRPLFVQQSERNKIKILLRSKRSCVIILASSRLRRSFMKRYSDCPQILREFLIYHENIKGQSQLTISEYYLDLRMFLRFIKLMRADMPVSTPLDQIDIKNVDLAFIQAIDTSDIFDFLSYLANDRPVNPDASAPDAGL